ncbi:MAG: hypothetical protein GIKADHBN_03366 [Phycisphaerales bacterium]|nr:hypothetical protein [Phycisphaerales bacterium]
MNTMHRAFLLTVALAGVSAHATAGLVKFELDISKFGKVKNVGNQCGPTSTANSFAFLQNTYTEVYTGDNRIIRDKDGAITDDAAKTRDALAQGWGDKTGGRAGMGVDGTSVKKWWASKVAWLEDWAPGKTYFDGQLYNEKDAKNWTKGGGVEDCYPTFQFLWDALNHGADIELNVIDVPFKKAHALTLVGMSFEDTNNDKKWAAPEKLYMKFIDPNDPEQKNKDNIQPVQLSVGTDGRFEFKWWQDQGQWYVDSALTETPVPSPASWLLVSVAAGITAYRRRR